MNERLPYEEQLAQQWNDCPLPDENMAWADMKRRLEEEEDKPLLPFWLRGCAGWGLLGILLLGLGWWIVREGKYFKQKQGRQNISVSGKKNSTGENDTAVVLTASIPSATENNNQKDTFLSLQDANSTMTGQNNPDTKDSNIVNSTSGHSTVLQKEKENTSIQVQPAAKAGMQKNKKEIIITGIEKGVKNKKRPAGQEEIIQQPQGVDREGDKQKEKQQDKQHDKQHTLPGITVAEKNEPITQPDTMKKVVSTGSVQYVQTDTAAKKIKQPGDNVVKKNDSTRTSQLIFSTGIGLQQQLPVAGQKWVPYNAQGRKGSLADYIPSVYVRLTKPGKWFLQSEFRYGAPQYTKQFVYQQQIVNDTGSNPRFSITTSHQVKKTYYHQLPLVFNYFIRSRFSIGAGIQWNKFAGAVAENTSVFKNNILQQDSVLSKFIQKVKRDTTTEFKKSWFQAIIETQYQWKRFSLGARYSIGLQPYIIYTLPGKLPQQEKSNSFQLFIRYEFWRGSRKK